MNFLNVLRYTGTAIAVVDISVKSVAVGIANNGML